jgi:diguanylate cyclase (GGDEF)-like protein/PAS domain S-box-containing protein
MTKRRAGLHTRITDSGQSDGAANSRTHGLVAPVLEESSFSEKAQHLRILNNLALALLEPSRLEEILWVVARTAIGGLEFEDCVIYLVDEERSLLVQKAAYGPKNPVAEQILNPIEIPIGEGIVGSVAATGVSEVINNTRDDPRYILDDDSRLSELAVPIVHAGRVIGVIDSEHPEVGFYTTAHREVLITIASMASTKIASAMTIERLNETVTRLERTEEALREGQRRYRMLYDHHPSMFFTLSRAGSILSANTFAAEQLHYPLEEMVGRSFAELSPPEESEIIVRNLEACLAEPQKLHRWESCRVTREGQHIWVRETARVALLNGNKEISILVVSEDITDAYNLAKELKHQATHDSLTGLLNRREFELRIQRALEDAGNDETEHAICFLDLDQFKVINDTSGHVAGDELLRQVSVSLREQLRKSDLIARIGGDEFGVLIQHCSIDQAKQIAGSMLEVVKSVRFQWDDRMFRIGASIGLVSIDGSTGSFSEVVAAADAACYAAKETGRNRIHVYSPDDETVRRQGGEMRWALRISEALESGSFDYYYQPIGNVNGDDSDGCSIEILLRMVDDQAELIPPDSFLPAAERYGYSVEIDRMVISRTLGWLSNCGDWLEKIQLCAVNLSGRSLGDDQFSEFVIEEFGRTGVPPSKMCFEITETAAIANLAKAKSFIETMRQLGCSFALDDFGSGLSSFAYLKNLSVQYLKIDGGFIKGLGDDPVNFEIVRSITKIAHLTGMYAVAEFVENAATLEALRQIGVDYAQGYQIGEPVPLSRFTQQWSSQKRQLDAAQTPGTKQAE